MIIIRVELHSAITGKITELARMHIANTGGTELRGDYTGTTFIGRSTEQLDAVRPNRTGQVNHWDRKNLHVWNLIARMLAAMDYGK